MKIVVINGSPKGRASNTQLMAAALLEGAKQEGAETVNIFLAEKRIEHCRGCFACWLKTPGQCVIEDDMAGVLAEAADADVLVLASPLYFDAISGMLKVFMDRMIVKGNPYMEKEAGKETRHVGTLGDKTPQLVMLSNCGFPERSHFQAMSHWVQRAALNMKTELLGEIYVSQGGMLAMELPQVKTYLSWLQKAGAEIAQGRELRPETKKALAESFLPDEIYIQNANRYFDSMLKGV